MAPELDEDVPEMPEDFAREWHDDPLHRDAEEVGADE